MIHGPAGRNPPDFHGIMVDFCTGEAESFESRASACRALANNGSPWNQPGDEADDLRLCPLAGDQRRCDTWLEQAAVWDRAGTACPEGC